MATPAQILDELHTDPAAARDRLREAEPAAVLIEALQLAADDRRRMILCDVLGYRHEREAVAALVACLADPSTRVRSSAADALAKIGDPRAGDALLARFELPDPDLGVRRMLLAALGAVGHRPAIPRLIQWLSNPDPDQRGSAAWSLGALLADEALPALEAALAVETEWYPTDRMREAVRAIRGAARHT
jgi:HEAT repeat protein